MTECREKSPFGLVGKVYMKFQGKDGRRNSSKISVNPAHSYTIHFESENSGNNSFRNCGNPGLN